MAKQLFLNNFDTVFVGPVKEVPSTGTPATELDYGILRISDGAAGTLLNPTGGDYYVLTAYKRTGSTETSIEIMRVTGVNNATPGECRITVLRGQEGTTSQAYVNGDHLSLRWTSGGAENMVQDHELSALGAATTDALAAKQPLDYSGLNVDGAIDGSEVIAISGGFKSTLAAVFAWFKGQANSWSGLQTFTDIRETVVTANTGSAYTINLANGTIFDLTLTANCAYTFPAPVAGKQFTLLQRQDATGSRVSTWPASARWKDNGTAPVPTATALRTDTFTFLSDGTYWIGFEGPKNYNRS